MHSRTRDSSILGPAQWRARGKRLPRPRPGRGELPLLLGRERVLDLDEERDVGALHLALHAQHLVHLCERRGLIDGRLVEQRGEPLRLLLHAPLQVHHLGLEVLDRLRDGGALLGAEPDVLLVLHHELRREEHASERVLGRLGEGGGGGGGLLGSCRGDGEQGESRNQGDTKRVHGILGSLVDGGRPSSGTARNSSSPGSVSRKSVGAFHRTVARSIVTPPPRSGRVNSRASATPATAAAAAASQRLRRPGGGARRARAAASVAWNGGAAAASSRRSTWNCSPRS